MSFKREILSRENSCVYGILVENALHSQTSKGRQITSSCHSKPYTMFGENDMENTEMIIHK
jgi:hypothetical protein